MGLDMYLERIPRYKDYSVEDVRGVERFLEWNAEKDKEGTIASRYSMKDYCRLDARPSGEDLSFFNKEYIYRRSSWDDEGKYIRKCIVEEVGYWRKANAIHRWFVKNIQNGIDNCGYHREVTKEDLEKLRSSCETVAKNPETARDILPSQGGFFFGTLEYDNWYFQNIENTIRIIDGILETTDFENYAIYYCSSW